MLINLLLANSHIIYIIVPALSLNFNHPEAAILSIGRIGPSPVVRDGEVVAAQIGYVSVTFDHRVVDGARAAEFGLAVIRRLEQQ